MARPQHPFDWELVEALAAAGASEDFIAERLLIKEGVQPHETNAKMIRAKAMLMRRRIKHRFEGISFVQFRDKRTEGVRMQLKRAQLNAALGSTGRPPNVVMLIWLGKQYLGQSDKLDQSIEHSGELNQGAGVTSERMDQILSDPETTKLAQELAIRLANASNTDKGGTNV